MEKVISVWGKKGSGKTTVSVNLAYTLASENKLVLVVSTNKMYGEMQLLTNCKVCDKKNIYNIKTKKLDELIVQTEINENLFILSVSEKINVVDYKELLVEEIEKIIEESKVMFDYVVIDCCGEINDALTMVSLTKSYKILNVLEPSISALLWNENTKIIKNQLYLNDKIVNIINKKNNNENVNEFVNIIKRNKNKIYILPYIKNNIEYIEIGRPIAMQKLKLETKYNDEINKIVKKELKKVKAYE